MMDESIWADRPARVQRQLECIELRKSVRAEDDAFQPTIRRANTSITKAM